MSKGNNDANVKSRLKTSIAKIIAAIGDLKMDAIAPTAAHAISKLRIFRSLCKTRLRFELKADAERMAGPNNPTDPPNPTVSGAVIKGK